MDLSDYLPPEQERPQWYADLLEEVLRPYDADDDVPWNLVAMRVWGRMTEPQRQEFAAMVARLGRSN